MIGTASSPSRPRRGSAELQGALLARSMQCGWLLRGHAFLPNQLKMGYNSNSHRGGERARRWTGSRKTRAESRDLDKTRTRITANSQQLALAA